MGDYLEERIACGEAIEHFGGAIFAAVVDHDQFAGIRNRCECFAGLPNKFFEILCFVFRRYQDADIYVTVLDGECHTRFRIRAGRMPS